MTEDKIKELFEKSQKIINMMNELGIIEYRGYSILDTAVGKFLVLDGIPITSCLSETYLGNDLSNFMPATTNEVMVQFNSDLNNNFFETLENVYNEYIK